MEWKWTKGEPYERTKRLKQLLEIEDTEFSNEMDNSAYSSSLNYDENTWEILNKNISNMDFKISNKREELDSKISDRKLVQQIGYNPFLGENNYIDDITIRDEFLKPINTTQGTLKNKNVNNN
jgi:hypothetical protein